MENEQQYKNRIYLITLCVWYNSGTLGAKPSVEHGVIQKGYAIQQGSPGGVEPQGGEVGVELI
jgi:hypothetical protein